jgi:putative transposase
MAKGKKHTPEQIVSLLRQVEVAVANGKELEQENAKLKRLVSEPSLEKLVLKDIASGNF